MTSFVIIGRENFAYQALKMVNRKGGVVKQVITDDDGWLYQCALYAGIPTTLKQKGDKVLAGNIVSSVDVMLSLYNYMYIEPAAIAKACKAIGYHPSLLPAYRGRYAIQDAIKAGENRTGGTFFHLDEGYDTGEIICQRACEILAGDRPRDVWARLEVIGLEMLGELVNEW